VGFLCSNGGCDGDKPTQYVVVIVRESGLMAGEILFLNKNEVFNVTNWFL
jgi:hypothetical protein